MDSPINYAIDDKDLDDAALWAVIDSAAAAASSTTAVTKYSKPLPNNHSPIRPFPSSNPSPQSRLGKTPRNFQNHHHNGEVLNHRPQKMSRSDSNCVSGLSKTSPNPMAVVKHVQRYPAVTSYSSPVTRSPAPVMEYDQRYNSPIVSECSPVATMSHGQREDRDGVVRHSLAGPFPSVSLFKEYQNAAMAIFWKSDYTMISGHPFIKKTGWRKISFYFNLSYEIKDKTIEFDDNRNVLRAEFIVRAHMQGGRFSDGWGSCERREKKFLKPNHDIPSTAETRAKNKACQDLLGIGEYRPGMGQSTNG
ncbi:uncharacterized protein LOC125870960 [Solanum stenotomum]|uniref:uncharacterized protein LOC125870960 n=1 Tax=Solanum stenotomum TaxID=172797 RepID=UPI0020D13E41|nr:uncharacterized protein LOC125870960 [Solanum stenotomum]